MQQAFKSVANVLLVAGMIGVGSSVVYAEDTDTPETVMAAAKAASGDVTTAAKEAQAIVSRMQRDRAYAERLLALARKGDKEGVVKLLKEDAPKSGINVLEMKDWRFRFALKTKVVEFEICVGSEPCPE